MGTPNSAGTVERMRAPLSHPRACRGGPERLELNKLPRDTVFYGILQRSQALDSRDKRGNDGGVVPASA